MPNALFDFCADLVYWLNEMSLESRVWSVVIVGLIVAGLWAVVYDRRSR